MKATFSIALEFRTFDAELFYDTKFCFEIIYCMYYYYYYY